MIRPTAQSFADVVSYIVDAWIPKCRCSGSDCCQIRQRMLNYLQRLILIVEFDASRATRFSSCMIPVETITSPCNIFLRSKNILLRERASPPGRIFHARLLPVFSGKLSFPCVAKIYCYANVLRPQGEFSCTFASRFSGKLFSQDFVL